MAIVQISRITQRKGLEVDLPQPLAAAELGWATDQRKLFIGNGSLEDGAPVVGNTEVLTEFSDILSFATEYTYEGEAAGYAAQTGATPGSPVSQSIQQRLDSYAVITAFGATGDGVTDVTDNINRSLFQLYCRDLNPSIRRSLFFPAGTYIITNTLNIPPYCDLYGEGIDSSNIRFDVQQWTSTTAYAQGVLVKNGVSYFRSIVPVPIGTVLPTPPNANTYWETTLLPDYIARTADSLQQTGVNIATNGALLPGSISISNMNFSTNQVHNGFLVEDAAQCIFNNIAIDGPLGLTDLTTATGAVAAVRWASTDSAISSKVTWNNCRFKGFTYGTNTDEQIQGIVFNTCDFDTLHQGAVLGGTTPVAGGATGVRLVQCTFDNIYNQGIIFDNVSRNASAHNIFYDVGNHFNGYALPSTSIIDINANNNVSIGDLFVRNTSQSSTYPRINLNDTETIALGMNVSKITFYQGDVQDTEIGNQLTLGTYRRTSGIADVVTAGATAELIIVDAASTTIPGFKLDYTIVRNGLYRTGTMTVISGQSGSAGVGFAYSDDYTDNGDTQVTLIAAHNLSTTTPLITITYTAAAAGNGTIRYSVTHLS
jgi:hypothetical protein